MRTAAARLTGFLAGGCVACGKARVSGCRDGLGGDSGGLLCAGCALRLDRSRPLRGAAPPGVDAAVAAAEHRDVARDLIAALKFRRRLAAARVMAARLAPLLGGAGVPQAPVVPVPAAPWRGRWRGFNPANELATALAAELQGGVVDCLTRRGEGRQVGRRRGARRAADFEVEATGPVPRRCILVDDVLTTGTTATACAVALRRAGATEVTLATFSRSP